MKARNISFAQVLKGKSHSPQLGPKPSNSTLVQLFDQWSQFPEEDYTLYLGSFKNSQKSRHSTVRTLASRNRNDDEEMFDSWIQRQSAVNSNKENIITQPRRSHYPQEAYKHSQPHKIGFGSKSQSQSKGVDGSRNTNQPISGRGQPVRNSNTRPLPHIGGNIQMIKSNTLERQEHGNTRSPGYRHKDEDISIQMEEIGFNNDRQKTHYQRRDNFEERKIIVGEEEREDDEEEGQEDKPEEVEEGQEIQEMQEETQYEPEQAQEEWRYEETEKEQDEVQSIQMKEIVDHTTSHIHEEIADLAKHFVADEQLIKNQSNFGGQSENQEQEEQDGQLLIGNSDSKPLGSPDNADNIFGDDYTQKARNDDEVQRKRRQEAKMKLNDLMKEYYNKERTSNTFTTLQPQAEVKTYSAGQFVAGPSGVGYSFASNGIDSVKNQSLINQLRAHNIQQIRSEHPSGHSRIDDDDTNFRKKYVRDDFLNEAESNQIQSIQSVQYDIYQSIQEELPTKNLPNSTFSPRLMKAEEIIRQSIEQQPASPPSGTKQAAKIDISHITHRIRVSLNPIGSVESEPLESGNSQKSKKTSSRKLKVYSSNSSKASNSSQGKQGVPQSAGEVKTKPFVFGVESVRNQEKEGSSPFLTIREVKESIVSPTSIKYPEATYKTGMAVSQYSSPANNDYSNYVFPSPNATYRQSSAVPSFNSSNYLSSPKATEPLAFNTDIQPSYVNPSKAKESFQATRTYQTIKNSNPYFKTEGVRTEKETIENGNQRTVNEKRVTFQQTVPFEGKEGRRSYLSDLQIKQSINVEEPKKLEFKKWQIEAKKAEEESVKEMKSLLDKQVKKSLKESITLKTSSEFTFDF